jgi:hypothetical protein
MTPPAPRAARLTALIVVAAALSGCGYSQANYSPGALSGEPDSSTASGAATRGLFREDVRTVAIPIFTNRTFERNVEFDLSKALVNTIESTTPYKVVPKERADTILEGEVTRVDVKTTSNSPYTSLPQEQLMILRVNFTWKDLRTGRILVQRKHFDQTANYYPTLGEDRFVGAQQNVEKMALASVKELRADW